MSNSKDQLASVISRISAQEQEARELQEREHAAEQAHLRDVRAFQIQRVAAEAAKAEVDLEVSRVTLQATRDAARKMQRGGNDRGGMLS